MFFEHYTSNHRQYENLSSQAKINFFMHRKGWYMQETDRDPGGELFGIPWSPKPKLKKVFGNLEENLSFFVIENTRNRSDFVQFLNKIHQQIRDLAEERLCAKDLEEKLSVDKIEVELDVNYRQEEDEKRVTKKINVEGELSTVLIALQELRLLDFSVVQDDAMLKPEEPKAARLGRNG